MAEFNWETITVLSKQAREMTIPLVQSHGLLPAAHPLTLMVAAHEAEEALRSGLTPDEWALYQSVRNRFLTALREAFAAERPENGWRIIGAGLDLMYGSDEERARLVFANMRARAEAGNGGDAKLYVGTRLEDEFNVP